MLVRRSVLMVPVLVAITGGACASRRSVDAPTDLTGEPVQPGQGQTTERVVFVEAVVEVKPELVRLSPPYYPDSLRRAGIQGLVVVQAIIDTLGRVEDTGLKVIQAPHPGLVGPALAAVRASTFKPAQVHGRPVRVLVRIPLNFTIRDP